MLNCDLFELQNPSDLFAEIQSAAAEYCHSPSSRLMLFLLFSLNHLREWIAGQSGIDLERKHRGGAELPAHEKLYFDLWELPEFRTINELCNRSKHFQIRRAAATSVSQGATCESSCNDSLGQTYYLVDGVDSRSIFIAVIRRYLAWFTENDPAGTSWT